MKTLPTRLTRRSYRSGQDYWSVRSFLREVFQLNGLRPHSWDVVRWDYWYNFINPHLLQLDLSSSVFIWEIQGGQIAAVLNLDNRGEAFFQVNPQWRSLELEQEMLETAEQYLSISNPAGQHQVKVWADSQDELRQGLLLKRGYAKADWPEYQRRRSISLPLAEVPIADGYTVRALADRDELPARTLASWNAFHPNDPDGYGGWEWYPDVQRCPLYRRDLDIVAVAPSGSIAAFCTVWFDDINRTGVFEPVGTDPIYQRKGLGKAVMTEGLRRLERLGAQTAYVGSYSEKAGRLYASVGFTEYDLAEPWIKEW